MWSAILDLDGIAADQIPDVVETPPPLWRTACPTSTADPCVRQGQRRRSTNRRRWDLVEVRVSLPRCSLWARRGRHTDSRDAQHIRPLDAATWFCCRLAGSSATSGDAAIADDGAAVDPTGVTWSPLVPQAAVTATRHSAAMNRAGPRGARPAAGMSDQESWRKRRRAITRFPRSPHWRPTPTEEPGRRTSAGRIRTCRHRGGHGWHAKGRNKIVKPVDLMRTAAPAARELSPPPFCPCV